MKTADIVIVLLFILVGYLLFVRWKERSPPLPPAQEVVVLPQPVYVVEDTYPIWNIETRPWSGIRPWRYHGYRHGYRPHGGPYRRP